MISNSIILLTGSSGFIGANLLRALLKKNPKKIHIILRKTSNKWRIQNFLTSSKIQIHYGDINNKKFIDNVFKQAKPEIIYHCATYGMFLNKQKNKEKILKTNILSLYYLIEQSAQHNVKRFINTGTTSEYGIKDVSMKENMLLEPANTYGATKASATIIASQLAKEYKLNLITLRLFSPYGYYEEKNRLFPHVILNYLEDKEFSLSSQTFVRDFTFIDDIINAYIKVSQSNKKSYGDIFNVGTGKQYRLIDVIQTLEKIEKRKAKITWGHINAKQQEPKIWKSDNLKIKKVFNWTPKETLESGLKKDLLWFKKNKKLYIRS